MRLAPQTRRTFLQLSALFAAGDLLRAQTPPPTHANVAELDRATILQQAKAALELPPEPPLAPVFRTEIEPTLSTAGASLRTDLDRTAAIALRGMSVTFAALTAGFLLTHQDAFAQQAIALARVWFLNADTRLQPQFSQTGLVPGSKTNTPAGIMDLVPLAEVTRAFSFLTDALTPSELAGIETWMGAALDWCNTDRQALIARDSKDHRASAHLLLTTAMARFLRNDAVLESNRKRFRKETLRHQVRPDGVFPQEVATPNPYRNTLMNFDLLAGACQLLSSPFDSLWTVDLIDGVGMRSAAAYLYPVITHPERWEYPADARHFRDLPGRRPGLLFAGRAYNRPEYVTTWLETPSLPPPAELASSFPIRQPALWTARAPHGR